MAQKTLLFWVSCLAALYQVCCGIFSPVPLRHPDLDFTEVPSAVGGSFVRFPFDIDHVETPGPPMQPNPWCRIITTQGQVHYLFLFSLRKGLDHDSAHC